MEVSSLLAGETLHQTRAPSAVKTSAKAPQAEPYNHTSTRSRSAGHHINTQQSVGFVRNRQTSPLPAGVMNGHRSPSNAQHTGMGGSSPKKVAFELLLDEGSKTRARIPMRVLINPHDTTDSIITTVKNFYGIYEGHGISFEDDKGNTLIARYENLVNDMLVYVRTVAGQAQPLQSLPNSSHQGLAHLDSQRRSSLGEPFQMLPPQPNDYSHAPSRPMSRLARKRSVSPHLGRGRRSASQQKAGSLSGAVSRGSSAHGSYHDDAVNGFSDSDGGQSSVTGSKKARSEQFASAEISLENVLQDGRRMRPNFESSELPLFVPPQVPIMTSTSSISPQRRTVTQEGPSPFARPSQKLHNQQNQPLASPQSYDQNEQTYDAPALNGTLYSNQPAPQHRHRLRDRSQLQPSLQTTTSRGGYTSQGILPTPDPTVASCISDEDVARQLIALGDASNFSHGRTSASTLDDAFSGVADAASSTGATSDSDGISDDELDPSKHHKSREFTTEEDDEYDHDAMIKSEFDEYDTLPKAKKVKTKNFDGSTNKSRPPKSSSSMTVHKGGKIRSNTLPKMAKYSNGLGLMKAPTAPAAPPALPRKTSTSSTLNFQHQLGVDEEDRSSKPRCQRCRKSKKGCDRQRPCQRCKDAGIGIEGCVSEDEGNGRKGRYGRHMGVPVKKGEGSVNEDDFEAAGAILTGMASGQSSPDKNKKRKR